MAKIDDKHAELLRSTNLAATTVIRPDGSPHTTPTWIDYDGEHVLVNTAYGRAKPRYLEQTHVASVLVVDDRDPYLWVTVSGPAELTQDGRRGAHQQAVAPLQGQGLRHGRAAREGARDRADHARAGHRVAASAADLRRRPARRAPERAGDARAGGARRARRRGSRRRACRGSRRSASCATTRVPQMAGAEEVVAAIGAHEDSRALRASCSTSAASSGCARRRSTG